MVSFRFRSRPLSAAWVSADRDGLLLLREKGESFRVDRYRCIEGRCLYQIMSAKTKVTKTKTALKRQETYNLSDLKHALHCGFVELGDSVSVSM